MDHDGSMGHDGSWVTGIMHFDQNLGEILIRKITVDLDQRLRSEIRSRIVIRNVGI